jgi:murein DD-endopeptidase MepM/ murein hydrolase activator NlpD
VPDKRLTVLTALAVLTVGVVAVAAVVGGDGGDPERLEPLPDHPPVDVESTETESTTIESTSPPSTASTSTSSTSSTSSTTTTIDPELVPRAFPVDPAANTSFTPEAHASYRATDIFASSGCGTALLAPVTGVVDKVQPNTWDENVGDPATRGGNAVSIVGDDGVRYYLAHFQLIDPAIVPGARVTAGDYLGEMGDTGRTSACHLHFALSLPCPNDEWWVRRGVIWPDEYLTAWQQGENLSPLPELQAWFAEYPDACASVENTPYPVG